MLYLRNKHQSIALLHSSSVIIAEVQNQNEGFYLRNGNGLTTNLFEMRPSIANFRSQQLMEKNENNDACFRRSLGRG